MLILDLYCCAGGAAMGYHRAGFDVVGVDIRPQPHYPFPFVHGNCIDIMRELLYGGNITASNGVVYKLDEFAAIHASPPCQRYSTMTRGRWQDRVEDHPDLIKDTRDMLITSGKPYAIENVAGARKELHNPVMLCGSMFGLQTRHGSQLRRHRYFELDPRIPPFITPPCQHNTGSVIGVYGGGQHPNRRNIPATIGVWGHAGGSPNRDNLLQFSTQDRRDAMGIQWMTGSELSEAIPPAYTEYVGKFIMQYLKG